MKNPSRFLNTLLGDRLSRSRKPKTTVKFCEYKAEQLPHTKLVSDMPWEWFMREATEEIVFNLLNQQVEYGEKICLPWTGAVGFFDLPMNQSEERRSVPAESYVGLDNTECLFNDATSPHGRIADAEHYNKMNVESLFRTMVMPMACAFVHRTDWRWSLMRFARDAEAWLEKVKGLAADFFEYDGMSSYISFRKLNNWWAEPQGDSSKLSVGWNFTDEKEFWRGFEESKKVHADQFYCTLEYYTRRMCKLIRELEEAFPENKIPSSFEFVMSARVWEQMVIDYAREEGQDAFLFFYGTAGEFFYEKEYASNGWGMNGLDGSF